MGTEERQPADASTRSPHRALRVAFRVLCGISLVAIIQSQVIEVLGFGSPAYGLNIFYRFAQHHEPIAWFILLVGLLLCMGALRLERGSTGVLRAAGRLQRRNATIVLALLTFAIFAVASELIYHDYPFSMDEFAALFQSKIFLNGTLAADVPEPWREYVDALKPIFIAYDQNSHRWASGYLPVHAALQTPFLAAGVPGLLNPALAASSVLLIADVARRLFPSDGTAPIVAVVLLVTSAQFVLNSISYYSMPAHLCANLLWLSLYLRNTPSSLALAPVVGGLALGLHQLAVHALFVFPFLLRLVLKRRLLASAWFASVYLGFLATWHWWRSLTMPVDTVQHAAGVFRGPGLLQWFIQSINLTLVFSWQSAAGCLLLLAAIPQFRRMPEHLRDLLVGVIGTFAVYLFFKENQGHGWGYRYVYGVLGNLVLLATFGWIRVADVLGEDKGMRLLAASTAFALLVQVPLRSVQAERAIRPFAAARDYFASLHAKVIILDHRYIWYGQDLLRNDPLLSDGTPIILRSHALPSPTHGAPSPLEGARRVSPKELADLGMLTHPQMQVMGRK